VLGGDGGAARTATAGGTAVPPRAVGAALLGPYVLAVELVAMLLLAGLAAASHIGRGDDSESEREEAP
jgi:NADH-quinone oxidoreductase subunit J